MAKADKDGWIRHRGGKCPVEAGVLVDVRLRCKHDEHGVIADDLQWVAYGHPDDVMRYRLHKPAEQTISDDGVIDLCVACADDDPEIVEAPLQWRDRITEIDRTVEALEEERVSLIQRLADEGLQLLQAKVCGSVQPVEDMSDWRNWKVGDLVECLYDCPGQFTKGTLYKVKKLHSSSLSTDLDDAGSDTNGWGYSDFKWHSRPSA